MTTEWVIILIQVIQTIVFGYLFIRLKHVLSKEFKVFDTKVDAINTLNTKIHDRMVDVEDCIDNKRPFDNKLKKRLRMTAANLEKYDAVITELIATLIETWKGSAEGLLVTNVERVQELCRVHISKIKSRVDALVE